MIQLPKSGTFDVSEFGTITLGAAPSRQLVGDLQGPAEWDEPDAVALIRHYLKQRAPKANDAMEPIETSG